MPRPTDRFTSKLRKALAGPPVAAERPKSTEASANFLAILFFSWPWSIIRTATARRLELADFPLLNPSRTCEATQARIQRNWDNAVKAGQRQPLLRALEKSCRFDLWLSFLLDLLGTVLDFCSIIILYFLYQYLRESRQDDAADRRPPSYARGIIWIAALTGLHFVIAFCKSHAHYRLEIMGAEIRTGLICCIARKSFKVDPNAPKETNGDVITVWDVAAITSLLNVHADRISSFFTNTITMARVFFCFPVILGFFIWLLKWIAAPAFLAILLCLALAFYVARYTLKMRRSANSASDERVDEMAGVLKGIRLLKFFGWENHFFARLSRLRRLENDQNRTVTLWWSFQGSAIAMTLVLCPVVAYGLYASQFGLNGGPTIVLVGIVYMTLDRNFWEILTGILAVINSWAALELVESFLTAPDASEAIDSKTVTGVDISLSAAAFTWNPAHQHSRTDLPGTPESKSSQSVINELEKGPQTATGSDQTGTEFALAPATFEITSGELVAIVGPLQSGKSSLLRALIGEMRLTSGQLSLNGKPAYLPQDAWIQSATVKDNILFGQTFDALRYADVLAACALTHDLERLPSGDLSRLGEKGVNISGGQKARIHLARTMYQTLTENLKVVLLDDPLSAVDARTCSILFEEAVVKLSQGRTRVLVTNQLHVLPKCDRILYMNDGKVLADGCFADLMGSKEFSYFVGQHGGLTVEMPWEGPAEVDRQAEVPKDRPEALHIVDDEERADYTVPFALYGRFWPDRKTKLLVSSVIILLILSQGFYLLINLMSAWWTANEFNLTLGGNIGMYLSFCIGSLITWTASFAILQRHLIKRARHLSDAALEGLLRTPLSFFQANPEGRILQRFTHDISVLDTEFPPSAWLFGIVSLFSVASAVVVIYYIPIVASLLFLWVILGWLSYLLYKATPLETKRLSVNLSSVYQALLQEGLTGRTTIALANYQSEFLQTVFTSIDEHNSVHFLSFAAFETVKLGNSLVFDVIMFCAGLLLLRQRFVNSAAVGVLVLALFLAASTLLQLVLSTGSDAQKGVNAVERLVHFAEKLPREESDIVREDKRGEPWLTDGQITFADVSLRYREGLPLVLKSISMRIEAGEKVGIVGRTGAGKSSLLMAMLRLVPLTNGTVHIDGTDVANLRLHDLRHAIATIPQDPVLFVGSIRFNLDPTGEIPDDRLLTALEQVNLAGVRAQGRGLSLDTMVKSGGSNFSSGERQLLSLARALAKHSKIIIIDEMTSNVDIRTDALVQQTIRDVFADCTVLTIAHRLRTVMYYDRICVMDQGTVVELAPPRELYVREGGYFRALCVQAGISLQDFTMAGR